MLGRYEEKLRKRIISFNRKRFSKTTGNYNKSRVDNYWEDQKRIIDLSVIVIVWNAKWNFAYRYFILVILWLTSRRESLLLIHSDENFNCKQIFSNHKQPKYTCKGMKKLSELDKYGNANVDAESEFVNAT